MVSDDGDLSHCFNQGAEARRSGGTLSDNPYPSGSDERREWDAGFNAELDLDEEDDPGSSRLQDKYD